MSARLLIGDVAKLLGVTTKTLRHYHRLGLLVEPERTEVGYRLYRARDVLRLQRIRRLQGLGLSLRQIKSVLGEPDQEQSLWSILRALHEQIDSQIQDLRARQARIEKLLAHESLSALEQPDETPPTLKLAQEHLSEQLCNVDPAVWELDEKLFAQLDTFLWPQAVYRREMQELLKFIAEHPEEYRPIIMWAERIAALAHVPEDSPEVQNLAEEFVQLRAANPIFEKMSTLQISLDSSLASITGEVINDVVATSFSPAQRRFFELISRLCDLPNEQKL